MSAEEEAAEPGGDAEGVEPERNGLPEEVRRRREAALTLVRTFGDPVLKSRASEVKEFGPVLEREAERMIAIMHDALGVGLAATQLGVMHRLLVFQAGHDSTPAAIANPQLEWVSEELALAEEGCLSLPGVVVDVDRPLHARVRGLDLAGSSLMVEASGLEARVLQHEIDHLDGVLILDRTDREQRKGAMRALREGGTYSPPGSDDEDEVEPA
jgi:peptide deformylase